MTDATASPEPAAASDPNPWLAADAAAIAAAEAIVQDPETGILYDEKGPLSKNVERRISTRARKARKRIAATETAERAPVVSNWKPRRKPHGLTFVDIFCGAGGSSSGFANAGWTLKLGANHWKRAIETHQTNFPDADHLCADVNNYDFRRLPDVDGLWISPICTEGSPAGGTPGYRRPKEMQNGQTDIIQELGHVEQAGFERTRATFMDVLRFLELRRPRVAVVENVPDVSERWILFDWWLVALTKLGYNWRCVSVSSAHVGGEDNPNAPQWRDRLYIVCVRKDVGQVPEQVQPQPQSWCFNCEKIVNGAQFWCKAARNRPLKIGKYRRNPTSSYGQYWYVCPNGCKDPASREPMRVEPFILPAVAALDLSNRGVQIADLPRTKTKPDGLAPNTLRRVKVGIGLYGQPITCAGAGNTYEREGYVRAWPAFGAPMTALQCTQTTALAVPGFLVNSNHDDDRIIDPNALPFPAQTTKIGMGLVLPQSAGQGPQPFFAMLRRNGGAEPVGLPMPTLTAGGTHHALIVPYYTKGTARTVGDPFDTVTTHDRFALVQGERVTVVTDDDVQAAYYRMITAEESAEAQRFDPDYVITGGEGERTAQAGNAVSVNAAQHFGGVLAEMLIPA